ncbi:uncharacterized protein C8A04DRAFT_30736 [Dichotomopilus funicola]|uniref:Uncharacterized protein n=1 Tax=Dichotomopilus funicola TaxID=1934379 RepID=A0AAN6UYX5_9PEZI|nr:hypothetical protein C8A04DRAFT_30736 [Dichotomopilus funicola]
MPDYKGVLKSAGERGSALKGQVKSKIGRGEDNTTRYENHTSTPLASLRDPASFAPPPKRNPNAVIGVPSPTTSTGTAGPPIPSRPGTFAEQSALEEQEPTAPPKPWRLDTTGLSTSHLPPPPGRKDGANTRSPPPVPPNNTTHRPGPPSLPPRLPPRSSNPSSPATGTPSPPPPYSSPTAGPALPTRHKPQPSPTSGPLSPATSGSSSPHLNQSAISRLSAAGVSVPGLGIGRGNTTTTTSDGGRGAGTAPALEDVRAAADAVNAADGFRRKHGEQVGAGVKALGELQGRFGGGGDGNGTSVGSGHGSGSGIAGGIGNLAAVAGKKKPPPPPPPKKKPGLGGGSRGDGGQEHDEPPPIPMATRPQF